MFCVGGPRGQLLTNQNFDFFTPENPLYLGGGWTDVTTGVYFAKMAFSLGGIATGWTRDGVRDPPHKTLGTYSVMIKKKKEFWSDPLWPWRTNFSTFCHKGVDGRRRA